MCVLACACPEQRLQLPGAHGGARAGAGFVANMLCGKSLVRGGLVAVRQVIQEDQVPCRSGSSRPTAHTLLRCAPPCSAAVVLPVLVLSRQGINTTEGGAYFNNAAVAVRAAQHAGARRVMVIDW